MSEEFYVRKREKIEPEAAVRGEAEEQTRKGKRCGGQRRERERRGKNAPFLRVPVDRPPSNEDFQCPPSPPSDATQTPPSLQDLHSSIRVDFHRCDVGGKERGDRAFGESTKL